MRASARRHANETNFGSSLDVGAVDALLEDGRRLEHHHAARRDRNFLAGLGIAADPLALLAHHERAERRQLHGFAAFEAIGDLLQHQFHERSRFRARQAHLLVDRLAQVRSCNGFSRHRQPQSRRPYPAEFPTILAWVRAVNGAPGRPVRVLHRGCMCAGAPKPPRTRGCRLKARAGDRPFHQRTSAEPQVKPPPMASSSTRSPFLMRPSLTATLSASGIEAAEVLPCWSTVDDHLLRRDAELAGGVVDDALVGLVRHEPVDVGRGGSRWRGRHPRSRR